MHFSKLLIVAAALLLSSMSIPAMSSSPEASSSELGPNVIVILSDDQGFGDVGYNGSEFPTPNLDELANEGVILDQFHTFPVCSPTRAALMTGRNPNRFGISGALMMGAEGPPLNEHFMPESFREAGYQTWMFGKWHLGDADESRLPNARGFDYFYGSRLSAANYFEHTSWRFEVHDWFRNLDEVHEEGYSTYLIGDDVVRKVRERDPERPFFMYLAHPAPHVPLEAPQDLIDKYAHINDENRRVYAAMVDAMDETIGKLVSVLEEEGIRDNTLIVFGSDNGGLEARGGGADNGQLRGQKGQNFQGGTRTPALVNWPGVVPSGQVSQQFVHAYDLFPTLAAAVGVETQNEKPLDGRNLWAQITGEKPVSNDTAVSQVFNGRSGTVWHEGWKLIEQQGETLLFNLSEDPNEENNLAASNPEKVEELKTHLKEMTAYFPNYERASQQRGGFGPPEGGMGMGPGAGMGMSTGAGMAQ